MTRLRQGCLPLCIGGLWFLLAAGAWAEDQTADLRPKWVAGQSTLYEFWNQRTQTTTISFRGNTREVSMLFTTEGQTRWNVDKVNHDGSAVCTMTLEWISATKQANNRKSVIDSRKGSGENEPMYKLLKAMSQTPLKVKVNADGSIESVDGINKIKSKIGKDMEDLIPDPLDFAESAGDLAVLPFAPQTIRVGQKYRAKYRWTHDAGYTDQSWTYTLDAVDQMEGVDIATVTGVGKLKLDVDASQMPSDGPPIDITMPKGQATTQVFYDLDRHEAVGRHSTEDQTLKITLRLPQGQGKVERVIQRTVQSQVLRLEEK